MRSIRSLIVSMVFAASGACLADDMHYVELVNTAPDSITSFSVAPSGTRNFQEIPLGSAPVHGGGDSTTIAIAGDECLRDFRTVFRNGRTLVQQNFDVCKYRSYHTGQYLRRHAPQTALVKD